MSPRRPTPSRWSLTLHAGVAAAITLWAAGCGDDDVQPPAQPDVYFDLHGATDSAATFWDLPFPSDLRLNADGTLDLAGFPNTRDVPLVEDLLEAARLHVGVPLMPVTYVRFAADVEVPERRHGDVIAPDAAAAVFLVDVDPASDARGTLYPLVAETLVQDDFAPPTLVAIAPRPGVVLAPSTTYAVVLRQAFAPTAAPPPDWIALRDGTLTGDGRASAAADVYAPLWPVLDDLGVAADDVLVATVFTTGDENQVMYDRSEQVRAAYDATISALAVDPVDGAAHDGYCELVGTVTFPQFQVGTPPFSQEGAFVYEADGTPRMQTTMTVPLTITIPVGEMPADGWPLYQFFHGSGGLSSGLVDLGKTLAIGEEPVVGEGPGYVVAKHGIAAASSALPLNPERFAGASDYEYLNINNLSAFPFTFQQGVFEQRLLLDALLALEIPPSALAGCTGITLPAGASAHHFDATKLVAGGQSMGGMYTNMIGSVEPRFGALVPTGAGGFWNLMLLETEIVPGARALVVAAFATDFDRLNFMHPALDLIATGWEIAEPIVAMSRLSRRPLPGQPPRHVYEPVGYQDVYFPTTVYDAAALSYGNQQAGDEVWPEMQDVLALDGLDGLVGYPVTANTPHDGGAATTNVVVQYAGDGIADPHYLYRQSDAVKHQYACFFETYLATGTPVVVAPGGVDDPCQ
ncbi:MAG: hypothetical protein H6708_09425 [Kofleriaceae bacterium]|nr:hypothetical protein [Kofleriaceae bacterium]